MKKLILFAILVVLFGTMIVSAEYVELPKGKCHWTRPATEYRPERTFEGVWGRFSDGSIKCFSPGTSRHKHIIEDSDSIPNTPDCVVVEEEVCEEIEECDEFCYWRKTCEKWCGFGCYKWCCKYDFERVCKEDCHTDIKCHIETKTVC